MRAQAVVLAVGFRALDEVADPARRVHVPVLEHAVERDQHPHQSGRQRIQAEQDHGDEQLQQRLQHRFPALFPLVALHRLNTETGVRFIEGILRLVQGVIPDAGLAARHFRTIGYFLAGAAPDETSGYARGPSAAVPVSDEFILRECPHLVAASRYFKRDQWDRTFAMGVDAMPQALQRDGAPQNPGPRGI